MRDKNTTSNFKKLFEIIAISGKSGCGNTSVSKSVAEKLNYSFVNYTFMQLSQKMEIPLTTILERSKSIPDFDYAVDKEQLRQAKKGKCVVGSRLAAWLLKDLAFTVYLEAEINERVKNIIRREGGVDSEVYKLTQDRDCNDRARFFNLYEIDNNDYRFVDLIVKTANRSVEEIAQIIIEGYENARLS